MPGVTLGHRSAQLGVGQGSLWAALDPLGRRWAGVAQCLLWEDRRAPVKHADETGWRNDGHNAPLLAGAMKWRARKLRAPRFRQPALQLNVQIFGSQSEHGVQTREIVMRVRHTLRERTHNVFGAFKRMLDHLAQDETLDPYKLLFDSS